MIALDLQRRKRRRRDLCCCSHGDYSVTSIEQSESTTQLKKSQGKIFSQVGNDYFQ